MSNTSILIQVGQQRFSEKEALVQFVKDDRVNTFLNDLAVYPHAYVLACCMDRQTKSELAWMIPWRIKELLGSFEMGFLASVSLTEYKKVFSDNNLHRFKDTMAEVFYNAVQRIHTQYSDDASKIWSDKPSSATVVYRFLQFDGVGIKIATMATNILARQFKVPLSDYYSIDVSPDIHVHRVMSRMGLINPNASNEEIIYKAREMYPQFPGIIDFSLWEIGRQWCRPENPDCTNCVVASECMYNSCINKKQTK